MVCLITVLMDYPKKIMNTAVRILCRLPKSQDMGQHGPTCGPSACP